ncbi:hypothetical protein JAAARDRAFT_188441 [Jaapia argillacea MUCL 33604]|uniref:Uncharacterized protein n=1 Tax=Jaapia argillacea MUCL 33604 TaxID=933084 RepID=A0A067QDQ4_9AGAM|nr:hypothetical protein JAAARDRAFT_188441 [Jaapia argillacea MUCL 33604]
MPAHEINTVINFICRIILLLMEGIHLFIILCTYARGILIHIHTRLLQLVISTTHATYQPIAVHDIHFRIDLEGNTAPTPPPPTAPLPGTPSPPTSPSCSYSLVIIESRPGSPAQPTSAPRTASPSPPPSTGWDPLDLLCERLERLHNHHNPDHPSTRGNTPDYENFETTDELE